MNWKLWRKMWGFWKNVKTVRDADALSISPQPSTETTFVVDILQPFNNAKENWVLSFSPSYDKRLCSFILHSQYLIPILIPNLFLVSQSREKDELDSHYRRDFITCDNQLLNGEMFLQVCISARWKHILNLLMVEKLDYMFPRCRPWTGSWWSLTVKESFSSPPTP